MPRLLNLCSRAHTLESVLCNKRSHGNEKPMHLGQRGKCARGVPSRPAWPHRREGTALSPSGGGYFLSHYYFLLKCFHFWLLAVCFQFSKKSVSVIYWHCLNGIHYCFSTCPSRHLVCFLTSCNFLCPLGLFFPHFLLILDDFWRIKHP